MPEVEPGLAICKASALPTVLLLLLLQPPSVRRSPSHTLLGEGVWGADGLSRGAPTTGLDTEALEGRKEGRRQAGSWGD